MKWEDRREGVFKFLKSEAVAQMWGQKKKNSSMTYEKLSRAMRCGHVVVQSEEFMVKVTICSPTHIISFWFSNHSEDQVILARPIKIVSYVSALKRYN